MFIKNAYQNALRVLENMNNSAFAKNLTQKINDSLAKKDSAIETNTTVKETIRNLLRFCI